MTSKKIINSSETAVSDAIEGLVMVNSGLTTMCGGRVVIRKDVDAIKQKSQVTIISGGGSGHEPAWAGYVGPGLLTAAVCGNIFASPPSQIIYETILRCASGNPAGTLVVVKNYTGDRVNFGLAIERAKALGLKCEMVVAAEDCALTSADRSAGRRGLCGSMLIDKVAGAMSEDGKCLEDIVSTCRQVNISMGTIGVSLGPCCLPGSSQPLFTLGSEEVELGLGIHGEAGVKRTKAMPAAQLIRELYDHMTNPNSASHLPLDKGEKVAVVINNLGGTSYLELNIVAKEILSLCETKNILVCRAYCGTFVTSLDMPGISLTILKVDDTLLKYLDFPTQAPAWTASWRSDTSLTDVTDSMCSDEIVNNTDSLQNLAVSVSLEHAQVIKSAVLSACQSLVEAKSRLNELDEGCGDGDTGTTLTQGCLAITEYINSEELSHLQKPAVVFSKISSVIELNMGGTSGALYGLFFSAAAAELVSDVSADSVVRAFGSGVAAIRKYGRSEAGDRTMLDALIPALEALKQPNKSLAELLADCTQAARRGADSTANMKAKAGRASYTPIERQTRVDPGAEAVANWLKAAVDCLLAVV